jgi:hypothetical protein
MLLQALLLGAVSGEGSGLCAAAPAMFSGVAQNEWLRQAEAAAAAAAAAYECTGRRKAVAIMPDNMVFTADTYVFVLARSRTLAQVLKFISHHTTTAPYYGVWLT